MKSKSISRRQFIKGGGTLIVSFSLLPPVMEAVAQGIPASSEPQATSLDSWLAVNADETITVYTDGPFQDLCHRGERPLAATELWGISAATGPRICRADQRGIGTNGATPARFSW